MGTVYKARDVKPDRTVALNVIRGSALDRPEVWAGMLAEARAVARVRHVPQPCRPSPEYVFCVARTP
jgi:hypothetical protein